MDRSELYSEAAKLKEDIEKAIHHPYLFQYIQPPFIDDEKLLLLCSITNETDKKIRNEQIISTILVQIAIDIHERILYIDLITKNHKERQLTVLAGDYFSSLYYERLTKINEQQLIRLLADGIKEINELKTLFLYGKNISLSELMNIQMKIESNLINQFSIGTVGKTISNEVKQLLLFKKLVHEKSLQSKGQQSVWMHVLGRHIYNRTEPASNKITLLTSEEYEQTVRTIESVISQQYHELRDKLLALDNKIMSSIFHNQTERLGKISTMTNVLFSEEG